jgi:hypothetical protein
MAPMTGRTTIPENLKSILICVDAYDNLLMKGIIYHGSFSEGKSFDNLMQLLFMIEKVLEETGFPKATTEKRRFNTFASQNSEEAAADAGFDFSAKTGKLASFRIKIMFRHNASWQGSIAWLENGTEEPFRSALEMLMLVDSAMQNKG